MATIDEYHQVHGYGNPNADLPVFPLEWAVRELLTDIRRWFDQGKAVALATVVRTWGSAPRAAGSKMAVNDAGAMAGSVSGGCVEGAVVEEALGVLQRGAPKLLHYGVSDETAWSVGLACGGSVEVFVEPLDAALFERLSSALEAEQAVVRAVPIRGPENVIGRADVAGPDGSLAGDLDPSLRDRARVDAGLALSTGQPSTRSYPAAEGEIEVFFDPLLAPPTLIIIGAVHIAIVLTKMANVLGLRVIVVDPRRAFATEERFPDAARLVREWPDAALRAIGLTTATAVVALSHDPKIDDPALRTALPSPAFYVGALGSRRTHAARRERLQAAGLSDTLLDRLHAPIGLDIHAETPEEIALSILAEIIDARRKNPR